MPFVPVHCGALPESLIESELFGHERGAFTGATRLRRGQFEMAHGGTVFLDEVDDIPLQVQTKLLRVLQDRSVQRVGAETSLSVDVRVIAATNSDLRQRVAKGTFRGDLYYRIAVVEIDIPPLRDRVEDLPLLCDHFLSHYALALGRDVPVLHPEAAEALRRHRWPGNVRELMNALERALLHCRGSEILADHLPNALRGVPEGAHRPAPARGEPGASPTLEEALINAQSGRTVPSLSEIRRHTVEEVERRYLEALLARTRGNIAATAHLAQMPLRTLYALMRRHGLRKERFKKPDNEESQSAVIDPSPHDIEDLDIN